MKRIIIEKKTVYGNPLNYPVDDNAKLFAELANTKTLSLTDLRLIQQLGYKIELALATHPLICECGEPKHANEVICEDCRIAYRVENSSVL